MMDIATELPVTHFPDSPTGCCPRFYPKAWDGQVFRFEPFRFIKATTRSFGYIPIDMGPVMTKTLKAITDADANPKDHYLILSRDVSKWKAEHLFLVDQDVPGYETVPIQGRFLARVFDGPFKDIPKWIEALSAEIETSGQTMKNHYAFYTTCPKCAKEYGHNYVVLFAELGTENQP